VSTATASLRLGRSASFLPPIAIATFAIVVGAVLWAAAVAGTFAFDFLAYHQAGQRVIAGERLYDPSVQQTGGFGLFYYPPPFVLPILPFALLPGDVASVIWVALLVAAFFAAVCLMPVATRVKWLVVLLGGLSWPVAYTFKLGQVGPLLMLLFAIGWRWLDAPGRLGASAATGALIKLQPGLVLVWAALTRRWRAVAVGLAVVVVACLVATLVVGVGAWSDYVALIRQVSDPITTPHNFTPGAVAYQAGASSAVGAWIQLTVAVLVVGAVIVAARIATAEASFLVAVVASQLLSPVLWDHYAMLLLLPVAWLLERRRWWAALIPLAMSIIVVSITPAVAYPISFGLALVVVLAVGIRERSASRQSSAA
jgi:alpha-1,2-mannosyltransferase